MFICRVLFGFLRIVLFFSYLTSLKAAHKVELDFFNVGQGNCTILKIVEKENDAPKYALFDAGSSALARELRYIESQSPVKKPPAFSRLGSLTHSRSLSELCGKEHTGGRKKADEEKPSEEIIQRIRAKLGAKNTRSTLKVELVVISHKDIDHSGWLRLIFKDLKDKIGSLVMGSLPEDYNFQTLSWIEDQLQKREKAKVFFPALSFNSLNSLKDILPPEAIKQNNLEFLIEGSEPKETSSRKKDKKKQASLNKEKEEDIEENKEEALKFQEPWQRDGGYSDCAYYSEEKEEIVTVSGAQIVSKDFQNAFKISDTVKIHLLIANASHSSLNGKIIRKALEIDDNTDSLVLQIRHLDFSALIPGDATGVTTDCLMALHREEFLRSLVLLASHHGSIANNANDKKWLKVINPKFVVISTGFVHGLPDERLFQRLRNNPDCKEDEHKRLEIVHCPHKVLTNTSKKGDWFIHETQQAIFSTLGSGAIKIDHNADGAITLLTDEDGEIKILSSKQKVREFMAEVEVEEKKSCIVALRKLPSSSLKKSPSFEIPLPLIKEEKTEEKDKGKKRAITIFPKYTPSKKLKNILIGK